MTTPSLRTFRRVAAAGALAAAAVFAGGCRDTLLEVQTPDIISPSDINSAAGAEGLFAGALSRLSNMTAGNENSWLYGGLLTDEWRSGDTFIQRDQADQRVIDPTNSFVDAAYRAINETRVDAFQAIQALRTYEPNPVSNIGLMWFVKGFAELQSASDFCNGQPLADLSGDTPQLSTPLSGAEVFTMAAASFDSALANAGGNDTVTFAAEIGKARALLGLGQVQDAAALVTNVPTDFAYNLTWSPGKIDNFIWTINVDAKRYSVQDSADALGVIPNSLPFASANDPRVPIDTSASAPKVSFDGVTPYTGQAIYDTRDAVVPVVNGIDARLAEAEADLAAGDVSSWLGVLNALRAGPTQDGPLTISGMPALTDPGSANNAQIKLMFRERAFWTFARGQRLGALRRMVRQYGMSPADVFPGEGGTWFKTKAPYGNDYNIPIASSELNNPNFHGCTDRNP